MDVVIYLRVSTMPPLFANCHELPPWPAAVARTQHPPR